MTAKEKMNSTKHHRVIVSRHGGPDVLQVVEEDRPEPQAGEVRVKVLAAGVSAYDLMFRRSGLLPGTPRVPFTLGADVVGVVDKLGEEVSTVEPGQRVAGATFSLGGLGGYAEFICLPASELVPVPSGLDPVRAVCVVVNYLTAHMALHRTASVRSGERILVHGAAGGVGTALLELGKLAGLEMYGTASKYNHELVSARRSTTAQRTFARGSAVSPVMGWMPCSTPSAAPDSFGDQTERCAKVGAWCGLAWLQRRRRDCRSFPSPC
jgi:NADPH:quinone reductase-like Zn-dependent oxidoreductase